MTRGVSLPGGRRLGPDAQRWLYQLTRGTDGTTTVVATSSAAYVFERGIGSAWTEVAKLPVAGPAAVSGTIIVVGASQFGTRGVAGAAYVFQRDPGGAPVWGLVAQLNGPPPLPGSRDYFGTDVAIDGDTAVIAGGAEAAYVFARDQCGPDAWGRVAALPIGQDPYAFPFLVVSVDGDTAVVGNAILPSLARIFQRDRGGPDTWEAGRRPTDRTRAGRPA